MAKQVHISLSDEAFAELEELKKKLKLTSVAEVIRSSVSLQKFLEIERENGNEIILRDKNSNKDRVLVMVK